MDAVTHYLDHAATTPMRPAAIAAWERAVALGGNPSALHAAGRAARRLVEEAREQMGSALNVPPADIIFTSGGTEADNLAVIGIATPRRAQSPAQSTQPIILTSPIEHHAVAHAAVHLASEGFTVIHAPLGRDGVIDLAHTIDLIDRYSARLALVSVMTVNNEIGSIQPVAALTTAAHRHGIPVHSDAVQAIGHLPLPEWPDAFTIAAHKIGGPMGVGALVARRDLPLTPTTYGGDQERGVRSGTMAAPLIAAFAAALDTAVRATAEESARLARLTATLASGLESLGATIVAPATRAPHILYALFPGCPADALLMLLDQADIACSTGSACTAGVAQPSHVVEALGHSAADATTGLRFSLGWTSTTDDIAAVLAALPHAIEKARHA